MYTNVEVLVNQLGNFDTRAALRVFQNGLSAMTDILIVVSSWDNMTHGVEQTVISVDKIPGTDVRIYSVGANQDGLTRVIDDTYTGAHCDRPDSYRNVQQQLRFT